MQYRVLSATVTLTAALALALGGCSSSDDDDADASGSAATTDSEQAQGADSGSDSSGSQPGGISGGTATITFADGQTLTTDVICTLEPQIAAGQEIEYTATSQSSPYFDVTVFGEASDFAGTSTVSWDDTEDFVTVQESWSAGEVPNDDLEVMLSGETISGNGTFVRGEDETGTAGETRQGEFVVECGN